MARQSVKQTRKKRVVTMECLLLEYEAFNATAVVFVVFLLGWPNVNRKQRRRISSYICRILRLFGHLRTECVNFMCVLAVTVFVFVTTCDTPMALWMSFSISTIFFYDLHFPTFILLYLHYIKWLHESHFSSFTESTHIKGNSVVVQFEMHLT